MHFQSLNKKTISDALRIQNLPRIRVQLFRKSQKLRKYEEQKHICPICGEEYAFEEMQGDHIIPWSKGGHTVYENLQMLCQKCNGMKGDK